jgi:hypothetical protein
MLSARVIYRFVLGGERETINHPRQRSRLTEGLS